MAGELDRMGVYGVGGRTLKGTNLYGRKQVV